jgi:hypothetical protein
VTGVSDAHGPSHGDDEPIHLPPPSLSPATIGLGVFILSFGILYGLPLIVLGGVIFVIGLATWLIDDARAYVQAGDPVDGHGHGAH